eukprot:CAMPEP_0194145242 /NCGR_PEP_ID=MMETSP0152-20130528/15921_1 /TAXON_ID=1049557 /ORGANISM="Thalassiothrix antarctica, Strain L6-D1" /LENGTH=125 /DNA_ID=CAMNT_0038845373 /DNA_START=10 /DNA_END=387 /DNA_ORIENTATION=+
MKFLFFICLFVAVLCSVVQSFQPSLKPIKSLQTSFKKETSILAGLLGSQLIPQVASAVEAQALEIEDLPPPYVPVIFGIVILGAVGVLTNSLGDVVADEARLGLQSGARAKKEIERSRSSYFKKK